MSRNIKIITFYLVVSFCSFAGCGGDKTEEQPKETKIEQEDSNLPDGLTPEQAVKVVARIGERTITVGDVTRQINRLSPYIRRRWAAPEKRKEFLEKLIRVELLSQEAERLGLENDPEVARTVNQVMIRLMVKNDLEKEIMPTSVAEEVLKKDYEENIDRYKRPAQVRGSQVVVKTKAEAEKLAADLKKNSGDARFFRQVAREISIDEATKDRGGDLGYFSMPDQRREDEPEVPAKVSEAIWKIENVGDASEEIVQTEAGFHVVKLTNKRDEMNRSFDSVKRIIENRLLREMRRETMDKFIEDLKKKAKIEIFEDNLNKFELLDKGSENSAHVHSHSPGPAGKEALPEVEKTLEPVKKTAPIPEAGEPKK
jgi:parvulin-like peptidyl-prolyl isomerase